MTLARPVTKEEVLHAGSALMDSFTFERYSVDVMLSLCYGSVVGVALGLTGAGGSILAIPLLVYGLAIAPAAAVPISLLAVGGSAIVGFIQRLRKSEVMVATGLLVAAGGAVGAPVGAWLGEQMTERVLMALFGLLLLVSGVRMWQNARVDEPAAAHGCGTGKLSRRCMAVLACLGVLTGILSGTFGVGGGFVIVPALILVVGMDVHHATATSVMVIALVSGAALLSLLLRGAVISFPVALPFMGGAVLGMAAGTVMGRGLPQKGLQQSFALVMVGVAIYTFYSSGTH